jgi:hypothetical protein
MMRGMNVRVGCLSVLSVVGISCAAPGGEPAQGTVSANLTGVAQSGAVYRLRDAVIVVDGPTPAVFNTEDDPTRTSLSADVSPGNYTATVQAGWRIERLDDEGPTPLEATLTSDNPVSFAVLAQQRTSVPLKFRIDGDEVDLTQGYDITIDIDESIPSPGDGYQALDAASRRDRLVFDAARSAIYAVNTLDQEIERFALVDGHWSALAPVVVPGLTDIAITPDGDTLIVLDGDHVSDIALSSGTFTPTIRATITDTFCGAFLDQAAAGSNNKVFIVGNLRGCSGFSNGFLYDVQSHALTSSRSFFNGTAGASADGSRIYIGSNGIFPADELTIYNPQSNTFSASSVDLNLFAISVSGDASHVILQNTTVYSKALVLLGNLPPGGVAVASRDSSRAYVYRDNAPGPRLSVYDLDGPLQAGAVFPLLRTIRLPHSPNAMNNGFGTVTLATSADDSQVFVSGDRRLLVVPVH